MSERSAEVIEISDARRSRRETTAPGATAASAAGPPSGARIRCAGTTDQGDPCRNYAQASGFCRVHEPEAPHAVPTPPTDLAAAAVRRAQGGRLGGDDGAPEREVADELEEAIGHALAFLRRRLTGDYEVDVYGFDRELTEQVILPLARPLYQRYWRVTTLGLEHVPSDSGALIVANHSGTIPFDAVMTKVALHDEHPAHRHLRELAADLALRIPYVGTLARKTGSTLAHNDDALRLLQAGELVGVWPEGFKGIGKRYKDRYKLQRFGRGGFTVAALRAGVPIVPVAIVGAEEIYPMVADLKPLARLLGFPYFPVTWQFPLLGPLGAVPLPSKWVIDFGEPIETAEYGPEAADDPMAVFELTDRVRDTIQQMLYRNLVGRRSIFF